jgi:hypothetical protein
MSGSGTCSCSSFLEPGNAWGHLWSENNCIVRVREHEATGAIQSRTSSSNTLCDVTWLLFQQTQLWFQKAAVLWFGEVGSTILITTDQNPCCEYLDTIECISEENSTVEGIQAHLTNEF